MRSKTFAMLAWAGILALTGCRLGTVSAQTKPIPRLGPKPGELWKAIVFAPQGPDFMPGFRRLVAEAFVPLGINTVIFDMHWRGYRYTCYPEFSKVEYPEDRGWTKAEAREAAAICRENGIRVLVGMNALTHQNHGVLLKAFPEFAEGGGGAEAMGWCPLHPRVNEVVFAMMDELLDAFQADGFHVGMDEGWGFQDPKCERCKGWDPAELWAKAVQDIHAHLVGKRGTQMLMWGDMLLGWGGKGTKPATDLIPKDVIICDWHYDFAHDYPSVRYFLEKGLRVLPCGWQNPAASLSLVESSLRDADEGMLGHLYTTWSPLIGQELRPALLEEGDPSKLNAQVRGIAGAMRATLPRLQPVASTRMEFITEPLAEASGQAFLSDEPVEVRVAVLNRGNFGAPVRKAAARVALETLEGKPVRNLGAVKSSDESARLFAFRAPAGKYRLAIHGTAKVAAPPTPRAFTVYGIPFQVLDPGWQDAAVRREVQTRKLDAALAGIASPPKEGKLLRGIPAADIVGSPISQRNNLWLARPYPSGGEPQALAIVFPGETPSSPGDFCQVSGEIDAPDFQGRLVLQIFVADNFFMTQWTGYRFYQVLCDRKVLWEEDILVDRQGKRWTSIDITEAARGRSRLPLAFRVIDKRGVGNYGSATLLGPARLVETP